MVGADGAIRQANRAALVMLGRSEGVAGADFADLFLPPDRRVEARQTLRAVLTAPSEDIPPIETIDAEGAAIRWTLLPLTDEADAADAILLAGSPVSEAQDTAPAAPASPRQTTMRPPPTRSPPPLPPPRPNSPAVRRPRRSPMKRRWPRRKRRSAICVRPWRPNAAWPMSGVLRAV
ncbi:PAS domain-containing protein [Brevundimonas aurantiaca]|uniref:PAS domain-containing protein n=1 Tax=Brevundimonas aurantiaca TaxID=74316 RepID=UPI0021E5261F|nr:PAS domain-containing protein [Brevundimonas aurantiaca]